MTNITYYGHACFLVEINGTKLLFDPFISGNPLTKEISIDTIDPDYILLTHGHQDHVLDAENIAKRTGAKIISNFEIVSWYEKKGIPGHPMNHGGKFSFDFGTIKYVSAIHSSVLPDGTYGGNPGGFVVWNKEVCFYVAGDTALTFDMKLIPMLCPKLDWAILPIGDNFTMGIEEAVVASGFLECSHVVGCHYDTFEVIELDKGHAQTQFSAKNVQLELPQIGRTFQL